MAVFRRGAIWHYDFTFKGNRYRGSTGLKHEGKAKRFVEAERDKLRDADKLGAAPLRKARTLREVSDRWFEICVVGKKTETDVAQRLGILFRHIDAGMLARDVGPAEITEAIATRRLEPLRHSSKMGLPRLPANGTVNRDIIDTTLRPMLRFAADSLEEPVKVIRWSKLRLKEPKGRTRNFTAGELAAWRAKLPEWHRDLFDFFSAYGLRLDEAFFPPAAVNAAALSITLHDTKNGSDHELVIHEDDMPALALRAQQAAEAGLDTIWFRVLADGKLKPTRYRGFQSASDRAKRLAGIENARAVHDLRHHAATTLYRATGSIKLIQDLLNHKTIQSSARYAHTNKDDLRRGLRDARSGRRR